MHQHDPHGARGSTEHHALDYKGTVKSYNSADIMSAFKAATQGQVEGSTVASKEVPVGSRTVEARTEVAGSNFHALSYKGPVKSFNSADLIANMAGAMTGQDSLNGIGFASSISSPAPGSERASEVSVVASAGPPPNDDGESGIKVRPNPCGPTASLCKPAGRDSARRCAAGRWRSL